MLDRAVGSRPSQTSAFAFPSPQMTEEVVLGFDFGTRRIGVALGNSITRRARPLAVIDAREAARWGAIAALVAAWQPRRFVVGLPHHPDGSEQEMTRRCERFVRQLSGRYALPVNTVDERYSSAVLQEAEANDAHAAAVILQQWFDEDGASVRSDVGRDGAVIGPASEDEHG